METTQEEREAWKATAEWGLSPSPRPKPPRLPDCDAEEAILRLCRDVDTVLEALEAAEALIAEELEPAESEPSGVSVGVDATRAVLAQARAVL